MPSFIRAVVPKPIKRRVRDWHRERTFARACADLLRDPLAVANDHAALARLTYGWGNVGYAARDAYLATLIRMSMDSPGDILECGSGLSTIALAAVANRTRRRVIALEHIPAWGEKVTRTLRQLELWQIATVLPTPLVNHGEYDWYDYTPDRWRFSLVVCDGPPSATKGGRYGLLPAMRDNIDPGAVILLDDLERSDEQAIFARWIRETGGHGEIVGDTTPFGVLRLPA